MPLVLYNTALAFGVAKEEPVCKTICAQFDNQTDTPLVLQEAYRISSEKSRAMLSDNPNAGIKRAEISPTLDTTTPTPAKAQGGLMALTSRVRRLTPVECERLQGFKDNWTRVPYRGRPADACPDSPRYKAIGNSLAVPCVRWIGERIQKQLEGENK